MASDKAPVTRDEPWHRRLPALLVVAAQEFAHDRAGRMAAALSYYTIFSLVPLLFVAVAVTAIVLGPSSDALPADCSKAAEQPIPVDSDRPLDRLVVQLDEVAGDSVTDPVRVLVCTARANAGASLSIGLLVVAFASSGIFLQVQGVLNNVFHVPDEKVRGLAGLVYKRLVALVSSLVLAVLVFTPVLAVGAVQFVAGLVPDEISWLRGVLGFGVPLISLSLLIGVIGLTFQGLTAAKIPWRAARRGGAVTAVGGLLAAFGVGTYLGRVVPGNVTFGALGGIAILLFFFNLMWVVYVFGAELTKVYADYLDHGDIRPPHERERGRFADEGDRPPAPPADVSTRAPVQAGIFAFAAGLVLGWWKKR
ncbi:MAG TPA: YihY/virulence factor BrkB family protein [Acidimicrobiia bacterium]